MSNARKFSHSVDADGTQIQTQTQEQIVSQEADETRAGLGQQLFSLGQRMRA